MRAVKQVCVGILVIVTFPIWWPAIFVVTLSLLVWETLRDIGRGTLMMLARARGSTQ